MRETRLPFLQIYRDRHGRERVYFRRQGMRIALRGPIGSADFHADYAAALAAAKGVEQPKPEPAARVKAGTYAALIRDYMASPEFRNKAETTRREYERVLRVIEREDGHRRPRDLRPKDVRKRRDERADKPGAANTYLGILSLLQGWAVETEWDADLNFNVCSKISKFKGGSYRAWTDDEKAAFEARWPLGTMQRLAYALGRFTGQRRSDLIAMTRRQIDRGLIDLRQSKTDEPLWLPIHRDLRAAVEAMPQQNHLLLLMTSAGKGFDPVYFGAWFADAIDEAGLPDDCVLHGLRHSTGTDLANAGASEKEIAAILGHRTLRMVQKYTKGAEQKRLARSGMTRLERADSKRGKK